MVSIALEESPSLRRSFTYLLGRCSALVLKRAEEELIGYEAKEAWVVTLCIEANSSQLSQQEVADRLGFNRNVMVRLLDEMERKHLLKRVRSKRNRQINHLEVLAKGRALHAEFKKVLVENVAVTHPLDGKEREQLLHLLLKLLGAQQ